MGSGASTNGSSGGAGGGGSDPGRFVTDTQPNGRRRLLYEYGGRRYDVMAYLESRRRTREERERSRPARSGSATSSSTSSSSRPGTGGSADKPVAKPLTIKSVDMSSYLNRNRAEHHTNEYDSRELIIRRGQPFQFAIRLKHHYKSKTHEIVLEFNTGEMPSYSKGTKMLFSADKKLQDGKWSAEVDSTDGKSVVLKVQSSSNCPVGHYTMTVITKVRDIEDGTGESTYVYQEKIYILFNPWCETDAVFMENEDEKEEYVLNESGCVYYGNYKRPRQRPWNFGQFDEKCFEAAIFLLQDCRDSVMDYERNNPVIVSRKMSAAVNVQDDGGILVGNWSGEYDDGARPTSWNGSVKILEQYMETKEPVKYGQCWVFSAVLTTVLRSLGIPARSVTNYASAHDTDGSMTIDRHLDIDGEPLKHRDSDSVWNFHVWNDCWMTRPDLPPGYGGWQAVDATPQETSEGIFQTGPASLNAIKQGHVYLPHDTKFVFAEINGDRVYWEVTETESYEEKLKKVRTETSSVGRGLWTKKVGSRFGWDINEQYKYAERSREERMVVETAVQHGTKPDTYSPDVHEMDDIIASIDVKNDDEVYVGDDFEVVITLSNTCAEERTVDMVVTIQICFYTGVLAAKVRKDRRSVVIEGGKSEDVVFKVTVDDYVKKLVDQSSMKIFLMGRVQENNQMVVDQDDFRLRDPDLDISVSSTKVRVGDEFQVNVALKNPIPRTLTNCTLDLEGAGLQRPKVIELSNVRSGAEVYEEVTLKAYKPGKRTLIVEFDSDQLQQVSGEVEIEVTE